MTRLTAPLLLLIALLAASPLQAQDAAKTPYGVTLDPERPARVHDMVGKQLAAGLAVGAATYGLSYFVTFQTLGFGALWMVPVYAGGPFATAAVVQGVARRHDAESQYRGALLGSFAGTLAGTGLGALVLFTSGLGQLEYGHGLVPAATCVLTATTALGATTGAILGERASDRRQRTRRVELGAGIAPVREGGLFASVHGRF